MASPAAVPIASGSAAGTTTASSATKTPTLVTKVLPFLTTGTGVVTLLEKPVQPAPSDSPKVVTTMQKKLPLAEVPRVVTKVQKQTSRKTEQSVARTNELLARRREVATVERKFRARASKKGDLAYEPATPTTGAVVYESAGQDGTKIAFVASADQSISTEQVVDSAADGQSGAGGGGAAQTPSCAAVCDVLNRLAARRLSRQVEMMQPVNIDDAEDMLHQLRMQNLALQQDLLEMAATYRRTLRRMQARLRWKEDPTAPRPGGGGGRPKKNPTPAVVTPARLEELERVQRTLANIFSPAQIKAMSRDYKKNSVQWSLEDLQQALALRQLCSPQLYDYLRDALGLPFPSQETLKFRCGKQGVLLDQYSEILRRDAEGDKDCPVCRRRRKNAFRELGPGPGGWSPQLTPLGSAQKKKAGKRSQAEAAIHSVRITSRPQKQKRQRVQGRRRKGADEEDPDYEQYEEEEEEEAGSPYSGGAGGSGYSGWSQVQVQAPSWDASTSSYQYQPQLDMPTYDQMTYQQQQQQQQEQQRRAWM